ncbi:protein naked cuticle isoform X1 [Scaptodrosophila lebanonensis]|uniref:Protein naked cuticle homolog n=1 Tax=Drosophila lebanonensis TaxID=7225 RepID=A0A6J2TW86_DROLE|nr:protein naked cuticle isoform X1 [Scaptodrosophila lebanonensis]
MAGNIVKWWKHKILGGYKQFSVQECTTDSEELMYHQVRASSSCSAPPDLLLVSERDNNIQLRSPVVNIITTPPGNALSSTTKQQQQQQQQHHHTHHHQATGQQHVLAKHQDISGSSNSKHLRITSSSTGGKHNGKYVNVQQHPHQQQQQQQNGEDVLDGSAHPHAHPQEQNQQQQEAHQQSRHLHQSHKEERIRLEEFTCDVSVEGGKSSQPLQFSFTFYDLDGHHGKITKDDIVGIVYTIYESIGKSVVVPHCGSKTINVRLTVSPEGKSKAHQATATPAATCNNNKLKKLPTGLSAAGTAGASKTVNSGALTTSVGAGARRQHRYRPRKLIKSDDEDDDSNSEKEKELRTGAAVGAELPSGSSKPSKSSHSRYQKNNAKLELGCQQPEQQQQQQQQHTTENAMANSNTYANMLNLKCCAKEEQQRPSTDIYMKQATQRVKMLRRARKQKYQDHCIETRQRSLSVGNETCWQNRHLQQQKQLQHQAVHPSSTTHKSASPPLGDVIDGVQLRQPRSGLWAQQRKSAECWKSALNRNDLIGIIRESMEKNRLCFQLNGKPQANVSPIRQAQSHHQQQQQQQQQQRLRSNTVSKIPTLIAHHSPAITQQPPNLNANPNPGSACNSNSNNNTTPTNNHNSSNSNNNNNHIELSSTAHDTGSSSLNHSHSHPPQPHIPIYHQQLAINPAVLAAQNSHSAHSKLNLCGYDSFLHATICGGGSSHSSPPASAPPPQPSAPTTTTTTHGHVHGSNVATVQPIVTTAIPKQQHQQQKSSHKLLRSGSCNNGSYSNNMAESQGQGYQRLSCSTSTRQNVGSRSSKDYKNYGNLIYAKLSEQLQQKGERRQRHKQQQQQHKQQSAGGPTQEPVQRPETSSSGGSQSSKTLHPLVFGDALECAHLLAPSNSEGEESTSGDLSSSSQPALASTPNKVVVSTDTLIDLNDDVGEAVAEAVTGKQVDTDDAVDVELDTSATSSMIHRYVHEHIHHHYHHFKEQHDV